MFMFFLLHSMGELGSAAQLMHLRGRIRLVSFCLIYRAENSALLESDYLNVRGPFRNQAIIEHRPVSWRMCPTPGLSTRDSHR